MTDIYRAKRGATLVVPLEAPHAVDADFSVLIPIDVGLKPTTLARGLSVPVVPADDVPRAATFVPTFRPATEEVGPGWNMTLDAAQTRALAPGIYATDAEISVGSAIVITEVLFIKIEQSVSA